MLAPLVPNGRLPPTLPPTSGHHPSQPNIHTFTCSAQAWPLRSSHLSGTPVLPPARLLSLGPYTTEAQLFPLGANPHYEMLWILWGLWGH